jgi:hypothetical protein
MVDFNDLARPTDCGAQFDVLRMEAEPPARKQQLLFRGPVSLDWLLAATNMRGKAGLVAIWLAFLAKVRRSNPVRMSYGRLEALAGRSAIYRAITALERDGLISV